MTFYSTRSARTFFRGGELLKVRLTWSALIFELFLMIYVVESLGKPFVIVYGESLKVYYDSIEIDTKIYEIKRFAK